MALFNHCDRSFWEAKVVYNSYLNSTVFPHCLSDTLNARRQRINHHRVPWCYAQNPLHTLTRNLLQQVVVMEFGKRHDTTDTTDFCPRQLITELLRTC